MIGKWFIANRASVLIGASIVGIVTLGVSSYYSGLKCSESLNRYKNDDRLTPKEKAQGFVKETWPYFIPPIILAAADCGMIIGAHNELIKRAGIATALAAAATTTTVDLKKQMREDLGETASEKIEQKVVEKQIERVGPPVNPQATGHGETLVRNMLGGRDFYSCPAHLMKAKQRASVKCIDDGGFVKLNDFFTELGIDWTDSGELCGWRVEDFEEGQIPVKITSIVGDDYEPILAISSDCLMNNRY